MRRALLLAALFALAGCGGEDKPSKEEFARSADAICVDLEKQSQELAETQATSTQDIVDFAGRARETARSAVSRVRDLEVPEGADGDVAEAWQDAVVTQAEDELIPALDRLEKAAKENDEQALLAAAQELEALESSRAERLAGDLGARRCAD
ncbi:MAG TPA: hypothetical protein VF587_05410 [Solirubrobacteraceae bacterium]|jgi:hypothetical protein